MIRIDGPLPATEAGTCNACRRGKTDDGTDPNAVVYEVVLDKTGDGERTTAFRLCPECMDELMLKVARAR